METKDQTFKISEKSGSDKKLKYDYSELDRFLSKHEDYAKYLSRNFRYFHSLYTRFSAIIYSLVVDEKIDKPIINEAQIAAIDDVDYLFQILEDLRENKE